MVDFTDELISTLRGAVPTDTPVGERLRPHGGSVDIPEAGAAVTALVQFQSQGVGNRRIMTVQVTVDVWAAGADTALADGVAAQIEAALYGVSIVTESHGDARLWEMAREAVPDEDERLARVTLTLSGRCFRRLE